jgi:hypothetical protein
MRKISAELQLFRQINLCELTAPEATVTAIPGMKDAAGIMDEVDTGVTRPPFTQAFRAFAPADALQFRWKRTDRSIIRSVIGTVPKRPARP